MKWKRHGKCLNRKNKQQSKQFEEWMRGGLISMVKIFITVIGEINKNGRAGWK